MKRLTAVRLEEFGLRKAIPIFPRVFTPAFDQIVNMRNYMISKFFVLGIACIVLVKIARVVLDAVVVAGSLIIAEWLERRAHARQRKRNSSPCGRLGRSAYADSD